MQIEPVVKQAPQRAIAQEFDLSGRMAVITGAASGIGRETARLLAEAGARTLVSDVNEGGLRGTARLIGKAGAPAITQVADVSRRAEIEGLADLALAETGRLDIWINVAASSFTAPCSRRERMNWIACSRST